MSSSSNSLRVALLDSGGANICSLGYALTRLGVDYTFGNEPKFIRNASHVILPGVGHVDAAMEKLHKAGVVELIRQLEQPVLGVCVGMQLLFKSSQEGEQPLLGLIDASLQKLSDVQIVPHMGWNTCTIQQPPKKLLKNLTAQSYFYFVHSYAAPLGAYTLASCDYGQPFSAIVQHKNFYGCQFHPERSARAGAQLLSNFLSLEKRGTTS